MDPRPTPLEFRWQNLFARRRAAPFAPCVSHHARLDLLTALSADCSYVQRMLTEGHALAILYRNYEPWWKRILRLKTIVGVEVWSARAYAEKFGLPLDRPFDLLRLIEPIMNEQYFTGTAQDMRDLRRYLKDRKFQIDFARYASPR